MWHLALTLLVVSPQMGALIVFRRQKAATASWEHELGPQGTIWKTAALS